MSVHNSGIAPAQSDSIRLIKYNQDRANDAWIAHTAMLSVEALRPDLKDNPAWIALRQTAYANFERAFQEVTA
jgi:hypothetical protein